MHGFGISFVSGFFAVISPAIRETGALKEAVRETEKITRAIDHILKNGMTDCDRCSLQKVCEEVEGMKALHFNMTNHS